MPALGKVVGQRRGEIVCFPPDAFGRRNTGTRTMARIQKKLGEILVEYGLKPKEIMQALEHAKTKNLRIGEALIDLKIATDAQVYKALAQQHNMEYVDLDKTSVAPNAVNLVPDELM